MKPERLTYKLESCGVYAPRKNTGWATFDKLGQLEDIEDELGIDLITLFKALKNGFETISARYTGHGFDIDFEHKCIHNERILGADRFYFQDYGKTWALTKEELE